MPNLLSFLSNEVRIYEFLLSEKKIFECEKAGIVESLRTEDMKKNGSVGERKSYHRQLLRKCYIGTGEFVVICFNESSHPSFLFLKPKSVTA